MPASSAIAPSEDSIAERQIYERGILNEIFEVGAFRVQSIAPSNLLFELGDHIEVPTYFPEWVLSIIA